MLDTNALKRIMKTMVKTVDKEWFLSIVFEVDLYLFSLTYLDLNAKWTSV